MMEKVTGHWTSGIDDFQFRIAADFVRFIETCMDAEEMTQAELADKLGVSESRVSQVLNNPGNLTLKKIVEYARAVGRKVAIVGFDDGDRENERGPVFAEVFSECWSRLGKPADFFALKSSSAGGAYSGLCLKSASNTSMHMQVATGGQRAESVHRLQWEKVAATTTERLPLGVLSITPHG